MLALGSVLAVCGAVLVVAEAHLPGGALGVAGGLALIAGGLIVILSLGGGVGMAVPVGIVLGAGAAAWTLTVGRQVSRLSRTRVRAGTESLAGRIGVVRRWQEPAGKVYLDGALWQARHDPAEDEAEVLVEGDQVVVECVKGLTLRVRRAEEWELI